MNWADFGERNKRLNPLWNLGEGMNVGDLNPYKNMIALSILLQVYYLELESNEKRTRDDLVSKGWASLKQFGLTEIASTETVDRLVDGLLWSGNGGDFESFFYDEHEGKLLTQKYKYFIVDEDATRINWENQEKTVFRLSEYALELIFMSHEIMEEFQISIKLLEIQMHIKHGRVSRALQDVNELIARVRKMIQHEKEYRYAIKRNPKFIFSEVGKRRQHRIDDIEAQFAEEREHFDNIFTAMKRLQNTEKDLIDFNELRRLVERVEMSRRNHDELAEVVLNIFEIETNLRLNFPELFWRTSGFNFRENVWEDGIKHTGLPNADCMDIIVEGLFSPKQEFVYPLPWAWLEQDVNSLQATPDYGEEDGKEDSEDIYTPKNIEWIEVANLWEPVFRILLEEGSFTLCDDSFNEETRVKWAATPDAIDLWMQFSNTEVLVSQKNENFESKDECQMLIYQLRKKDAVFEALCDRLIKTDIVLDKQRMIRWPGLIMSPFRIRIGEE